jgi:hypothetical protein
MYITEHAIRRYMQRIKGSSREHALEQLKGFADSVEFKDHLSGAKYAHVADLTLICRNDTMITIYNKSEYEKVKDTL